MAQEKVIKKKESKLSLSQALNEFKITGRNRQIMTKKLSETEPMLKSGWEKLLKKNGLDF
jgi:5-bromo-4-chloroindolyl phosphate hydrolysis protein